MVAQQKFARRMTWQNSLVQHHPLRLFACKILCAHQLDWDAATSFCNVTLDSRSGFMRTMYFSRKFLVERVERSHSANCKYEKSVSDGNTLKSKEFRSRAESNVSQVSGYSTYGVPVYGE